MKKIIIQTESEKYPVLIGSSIIQRLPELISKFNLSRRVFVLIDKKVYKLYGREIRRALKNYSDKINYFPLAASEKSKSLTSAKNIYSSMLKNRFGRDTLLITVGGGTIGDVGAFAASTYMRGIQLVQIPTTILASVDSSIGGKTAINFLDTKNVIGTFYHPELVLIDTVYFNTLSDEEIISGMGEVIKYTFLSNPEFHSYVYSNFDHLLKLKPDFLNKVISECIKIKAAVVGQDQFETRGLRKILNLGHTFAHAFESYSNFKIRHGKAVTAGLIAALFLSYRKKLIHKRNLNEFLQLPLLIKNKKLIFEFDIDVVIDLMKTDKKIGNDQLNFVLINDIGKIVIDVSVNKSDIKYSLERTKEMLL